MKTLPRIKIAQLPTPIQPMPRLASALGAPAGKARPPAGAPAGQGRSPAGAPRLLIKRDDQTGLAFGGNKTRKLELLVAEAQANAARTLVTAGAVQSNHCRQTAAAAAHFGLDCILVLSGEKPSAVSGNLLLDQLFGAELVWVQRQERDQRLKETFQEAWDKGRRPYLVPYGGSSPTGAAAYALALGELMEQCRQSDLEGCPPDWIVFPSSSGGTQAGLVLGARLYGYSGKVLGISVDEPANVLKARVAKLAGETADLLAEQIAFSPDDVLVEDSYLGAGYGVMGEPEREAIRLFARTEGLLLDPVYTGRAAAGLIDLVHKGFFSRGETVLFWHTGGTPALFADQNRDLV